jgi:hypothetical protein
MSPRAACRLEGIGFTRVYDYVDGIADWKAAGLPTEGTAQPEQRVGDTTRSDVPTCRRDKTIGDMGAKVVDGGWDVCVVTDCDGMAIGRIDKSVLDANPDQRAVDVMEPGAQHGPAQQPPPTPRRADAHPERTTCHRHHPTRRAHRDTHQRRGRPPSRRRRT